MSILVERFNQKTAHALNVVYVGRKAGNIKGNILGNPYKIGKDGTREEVIAKYRKWLWIEINKKEIVWEVLLNLLKFYKNWGGDLILTCWCKPEICHADIIKNCLEWMIEQGY